MTHTRVAEGVGLRPSAHLDGGPNDLIPSLES